MKLTQSRLKGFLEYFPKAGVFRWRVKTHGYAGSMLPGDLAGQIKRGEGGGYVMIGVDGHSYRGSHLAWLYMTGEWPPRNRDVDHVNGARSDDRWNNLRLVTRSQNNMNGGMYKNNKTGVRGVRWRIDRQKYAARITVNGKIIDLGSYDDIAEATAARQAAEKRYHGEFTRSH